MAQIEKRIHEHFASIANETEFEGRSLSTQSLSTSNGSSNPRNTEPLESPFARVNSVVPGSPADSAGLKAGDEIRNFGYVNRENHNGLRRLADVVNGNEGVSL